jgi:hypothetical protein
MGGTVHLFLNEGGTDSTTILKLILPYEYGDVMTQDDMDKINAGLIHLNIVYHGVNEDGTDKLELIT